MRKSLVLLLVISLTFSSTLVLLPVEAQYQGKDITINAYGSVSPQSAAILKNGNTYTLMSDQAGAIIIAKSNITFNGNGHTINQEATFQTNGNAFGIILSNVHNVIVTNATIINTGNGVYSMQNPTAAIGVHYGGSNLIIGNNVVNNYNAVNFLETNNNIITQNNFTNNNNPVVIVSAVMLWGSSNNSIYQNNFIDNKRPAGSTSFNSESSGNTWDNGNEGNYWDDYNGTDADGDGIGDSPYEIYTKNKSGTLYPKNTDHYPLMAPFNSTLFSLKTTPPKITVISPANQAYNESTVPLLFDLDKPINWLGYSLDAQAYVTVTGNTTISGLPNSLHNITVYANDTFGNMGSSQTISFTIVKPEPLPPLELLSVLPVAAVSITVAVLVTAGLLIHHKRRVNHE